MNASTRTLRYILTATLIAGPAWGSTTRSTQYHARNASP